MAAGLILIIQLDALCGWLYFSFFVKHMVAAMPLVATLVNSQFLRHVRISHETHLSAQQDP